MNLDLPCLLYTSCKPPVSISDTAYQHPEPVLSNPSQYWVALPYRAEPYSYNTCCLLYTSLLDTWPVRTAAIRPLPVNPAVQACILPDTVSNKIGRAHV